MVLWISHVKSTKLLMVVILACLVGCSDNGPPMGQVKGRVTLDGIPIKEGVINFFSKDGSTKTVSTFILNGEYDVMVPVGSQRVEISCVSVPELKAGQNPETLIGREIIPSRYNSSSELELEVSQSMDTVNFELLGK